MNNRKNAGETLVEMIVSLLLISILMLMVIGIVSPASKLFVRMQKLQFAQMVLDNTEDEIRSRLQDASGFVKIYTNETAFQDGNIGADSGEVLEFTNTDGYVAVLSAAGCQDISLIRGNEKIGTSGEQPKGRLLMRYYWQQSTETNTYFYYHKDVTGNIARAVQLIFTEKYYMGNYIKTTFTYPNKTGEDAAGGEKIAEGADVPYLQIHLAVYRDKEGTKLVTEEDFIVELRYTAKRYDKETAKPKPPDPADP